MLSVLRAKVGDRRLNGWGGGVSRPSDFSSDVGVNRGETDHRPRPFLSSLSPSPYRDLRKCRISHVIALQGAGCHYSRLTITTLSLRDIVRAFAIKIGYRKAHVAECVVSADICSVD